MNYLTLYMNNKRDAIDNMDNMDNMDNIENPPSKRQCIAKTKASLYPPHPISCDDLSQLIKSPTSVITPNSPKWRNPNLSFFTNEM